MKPIELTEEVLNLGIVTVGDENAVKFGRLLSMLEALAVVEDRVERAYGQATALEVKDKDSRELAGSITTTLKGESKLAEAATKPYETPVNRMLDWFRQRRQKVTNRCEEARGVLARKMAEYDRLEEQRTAAENKRLQEESDKQQKQQADRELRAGDITKKEHKERLATTPQVTVAPAIPKVPGNVRRINYTATCSNVPAFLRAMCEAYQNLKDRNSHELFLRLASMIIVSDQRLSAQARGLIKTSPQDDKHTLTVEQFKEMYPFVEVYEDRTY